LETQSSKFSWSQVLKACSVEYLLRSGGELSLSRCHYDGRGLRKRRVKGRALGTSRRKRKGSKF
jgi:hypothetical protein